MRDSIIELSARKNKDSTSKQPASNAAQVKETRKLDINNGSSNE